MIDVLAALVSPEFGLAALTSFLVYLTPASQALLVAIAGLRIAWIASACSIPGAELTNLISELGWLIVRTLLLLWLLAQWVWLSTMALEEGPRLAATIVGTAASPEQLATKMVAIAARFSDTTVFGTLDWVAGVDAQTPFVSAPQTEEFANHANWPAPSAHLLTALVAILSAVLTQAVAAAGAMMIALPKFLLLLCLGVGPLAIATTVTDSRRARAFVEGWAETTASAVLALPVMAILVVFISNAPLPDPSIASGVGDPSRPAVDVVIAFANDLALLLLVGQLLFMVLPIACGLVRGRPPSASSFFALALAVCWLPLRSIRTLLSHRAGAAR
ncbi:MAG TPA: type IV secretion system protein [Usitatibacter sp.]|nr:type IV secretion system protein [Usitatibacter sp.]